MKKLIFTFAIFCLCFITYAQTTNTTGHCPGASGSSVCTPVDTFTKPGLYPVSDSLAPLTCGVATSSVINFKNYDTTYVASLMETVTIEAVIIDTIDNLPDGLCWQSSSPTDSFINQQNGCILVSGTPDAVPGQYRLNIAITAYIQGLPEGIPYNANGLGLYYYVRVNAPTDDTVHPVDTAGQAAGTNLFKAYATPGCASAINVVASNDINNISVAPNPFNNQTLITFSSLKTGVMTEKLTNVIGSEVYSKDVDVTVGVQSHYIERGNLAAGVYFYTLSDGKTLYTKRLVITD